MAVTREATIERWIGLSTDTKPTGVRIGATFYEYDTKNWYKTYDGTNWVILALDYGLAFGGTCNSGMTASTTTIACADLAGYGTDYFNTQFYMQVVKNANSIGGAPDGEIRKITDYVTASGTFTVDAFSANVEASDEIYILHRSIMLLLTELPEAGDWALADYDLFDVADADANNERWNVEYITAAAGGAADINTTTSGKLYIKSSYNVGGANRYAVSRNLPCYGDFIKIEEDVTCTWGTTDSATAKAVGIGVSAGSAYDANNYIFIERQKGTGVDRIQVRSNLNGAGEATTNVAVTDDSVAFKIERLGQTWGLFYSTIQKEDGEEDWVKATEVEDPSNYMTNEYTFYQETFNGANTDANETAQGDFDNWYYWLGTGGGGQYLQGDYDSSHISNDIDGNLFERVEAIQNVIEIGAAATLTSYEEDGTGATVFKTLIAVQGVTTGAGDSTTVTSSARTEGTDYWNGHYIAMIEGACIGQMRVIVDDDGAGSLTVRPAFSAASGDTNDYIIFKQFETPVPATDGTDNYQIRDVVGSKADTEDYTYNATTSSMMRKVVGILASRVVGEGTFTTGGTTTAIDTSRTEGDDYWNGCLLMPVAGDAAFQPRLIVDYDSGTDTFTIDGQHPFAPATTTVAYVILAYQGALIPGVDATTNQTPAHVIGSKADTIAAMDTAPVDTDSIVTIVKNIMERVGATPADPDDSLHTIIGQRDATADTTAGTASHSAILNAAVAGLGLVDGGGTGFEADGTGVNLYDVLVAHEGLTTGVGDTTSIIDTGLGGWAADNLNGLQVLITSGAAEGLVRTIVDFDGTSDLTVEPAMFVAVGSGESYIITSHKSADWICGDNNASNAYDSSTVTADDDGSILERLEWIQQMLVVAKGTFTTGSTTEPIDTSRTEGDNYWNGCLLMPLTGDAAMQPRLIVDYDSAADKFYVDPNQPFTLATGTVEYVVLAYGGALAPAADQTESYTVMDVVGNKSDAAPAMNAAPGNNDTVIDHLKALRETVGQEPADSDDSLHTIHGQRDDAAAIGPTTGAEGVVELLRQITQQSFLSSMCKPFQVTSATSTTVFASTSLIGCGEDAFPAPWACYVMQSDNAAPEGEIRLVTDFEDSTGTVTVGVAYTAAPDVGDWLILLHPSIASLGDTTTAATTGAVTTTDYLMGYVKQLVNIFQLADDDLSDVLDDSPFAHIFAQDGDVSAFNDENDSLEALGGKQGTFAQLTVPTDPTWDDVNKWWEGNILQMLQKIMMYLGAGDGATNVEITEDHSLPEYTKFTYTEADADRSEMATDSYLAQIMAVDGTPGDFNDNTMSLEALNIDTDAIIVNTAELFKTADGDLSEVTDDSILAQIMAQDGDISEYNDHLMSLEAIRYKGLSFKGAITTGGSQTAHVITQMIGFGDNFFNDEWFMFVSFDTGDVAAAPQGEVRQITDYESSTGTFTTAAFTVATATGDIVAIVHRSILGTLGVIADITDPVDMTVYVPDDSVEANKITSDGDTSGYDRRTDSQEAIADAVAEGFADQLVLHEVSPTGDMTNGGTATIFSLDATGGTCRNIKLTVAFDGATAGNITPTLYQSDPDDTATLDRVYPDLDAAHTHAAARTEYFTLPDLAEGCQQEVRYLSAADDSGIDFDAVLTYEQ